MAKFAGIVGFGEEVEIDPGVWEMTITEREYRGEFQRETLEGRQTQMILGESKTLSAFRIVADPYALTHFFDMKYIVYLGKYWEIRQVEVQNRPRLMIRIGGIWNGPKGPSANAGPVTP